MPLDLIRVDERLLHGQVVVGWGEHLGLRWYVVADDELAGSDWEQEIYAGALPDGVDVIFLTVDEAAGRIEQLGGREEPGALLTRTTSAMRRLAETGALEGRRVNLGCLAADEGRREACPFLHLSRSEEDDVREIARRGGEVHVRDVPSARARKLEDVLDGLGD